MTSCNYLRKNLKKSTLPCKPCRNLKLDADSPEIDSKVKEQVITNLNDREKSLETFKDEWDKYIAGINDVQSKVGNLKDKIPTLEINPGQCAKSIGFL